MSLTPSIKGLISQFCFEAKALDFSDLSAEYKSKLLTKPRLSGLGAALGPILDSLDSDCVVTPILSDCEFMSALLRTFAWATWGIDDGRDKPLPADSALGSLQLDVGNIVARLVDLGFEDEALEQTLYSLVKSLVRMQAPQCLSRALSSYASAAEELRMLAQKATAPAASAELQGEVDYAPAVHYCSSAAWMVGLLASLAFYGTRLRRYVDQAESETSTGGPTKGRRRRAGTAGHAQQEPGQLQVEQQRAAVLAERKGCLQELEAALSESGAVEHAARAVLLLAEVASNATGGAATAGTPWANLDVALSNCASLMFARMSLHGPSLIAWAGPCTRHLMLACGLAALCDADGGAAYGMPRSVLTVLSAAGRDRAEWALLPEGLTPIAREHVVDPFLPTLTDGLDLFSPSLPPQPLPLKRGAIRTLLLRFGHWAVASAREYAKLEADDTSAAAATAADAARAPAPAPLARPASSPPAGALPPPVGAGATAGPAESSAKASGQAEEPTGQAVRTRQYPLLLEDEVCCPYALYALQYSKLLLPRASSPAAAAHTAAVEWWQLAVAVALHVRHNCGDANQAAMADALRLEPSALGDQEGVLPPAPPPPVAAALGGGLLGCTEALLRRAGRNPGGREAGILMHLAYSTEEGEAAWPQFAPLLAYGEPRGAASLIATIRKVLRRALPPLIAAQAQQACGLAAQDADGAEALLRLAFFMLMDGHDWLAAAAAADQHGGAGTAAAAAQGAAMPAPAPQPAGPASAAQRQLASMLSYALCSWLPMLSRHCALAFVLRTPAFPDGVSSCSILRAALWPLLRWLPILARGVAVSSPAPSQQTSQSLGGGAATAASASVEQARPEESGNPATGSAECANAEACGGWRNLVLEEMGAVPLIGALFSMGTRLADGSPMDEYLKQLADSGAALAAACPQEVRRAAKEAAPSNQLPVSGGVGVAQAGRSRRPPRHGRASGGAAGRAAQECSSDKAIKMAALHNVLCLAGGPAGEASRPDWYPSAAQWLAAQEAGGGSGGGACGNLPSVEVPVWPPAMVRSLAALPEARGAAASRLSALASQLERWAAGQDAGGEPAGSAGGAGGGGGSSVRAGGGGGTHDGSLDALLRALTPPAEARRLLRTCAYPGCVNLEGDSEADLPLQACSRCGEAWYCGRDCQLAHWRAGHRAACERSRQASALQKDAI